MCDTVPSHTDPLAVVFTNTSSVYLLFNSECDSITTRIVQSV